MSFRCALFIFLFTATSAETQVHGRIVDGRSEEGIPAVLVQLTGKQAWRVGMTDRNGAYAFDALPAGEYCVRADHPGYRAGRVCIVLPAGSQLSLDVPLELRPVPMAPLVVIARAEASSVVGVPEETTPDAVVSGLSLAPAAPQSAGAFGDLLTAEFSREPRPDPPTGRNPHALYIWGSTAERGRIFLDGATINAPLHLGNLLPPLEPDLLNDAVLRSGGTTPRYDGGISWISRFSTRPAVEDFRFWAEVDPLATRLGLATLFDRKGGVTAGVRHVNAGLIGGLLTRSFGYSYADALTRADWSSGTLGDFRATGLATREAVRIPRDREEDEASWSNLAMALAWSNEERKGRTSLLATFSRGLADLPLLSAPGGHLAATVDRVSATVERRWALGSADLWIGGEFENLQFARRTRADADMNPRAGTTESPQCTLSLPCSSAGATTAAVFSETVFQPVPLFTVIAGLRASYRPSIQGFDLLPRLSANTLIGSRSVLTLSAGRFSQVVTSDSTVAEDTLEGSVNVADPELDIVHASHLDIGLRRHLKEGFLRITGFLRRHEPVGSNSTRHVPGGEIFLAQATPLGMVSLGYYFLAVQSDERDQHIASIGYLMKKGRWRLSVSTAYAAGLPFTSIILERPPESAWVPGPGPNSFGGQGIDQAFVRLDASASAEWNVHWFGRDVTVAPYGKVINALNRREALFYYQSGGSIDNPEPLARVPALPVIGLRVEM